MPPRLYRFLRSLGAEPRRHGESTRTHLRAAEEEGIDQVAPHVLGAPVSRTADGENHLFDLELAPVEWATGSMDDAP
jgi:hypothetical protein